MTPISKLAASCSVNRIANCIDTHSSLHPAAAPSIGRPSFFGVADDAMTMHRRRRRTRVPLFSSDDDENDDVYQDDDFGLMIQRGATMTTSTTAMEAGRAFWRARLSSSSTHDGMVATTTTTRGLDEALTAGECVAFGLPRGKAASQTSKATVVGMYAAVLDGRGYGFGGGARDGYRRACDAPLTTSAKDVCRFEAVKSDDATRARGAERRKSFDPKPTDGATQLVVMRVGKYYGFRSHAAGGKLLQARRHERDGDELCFFNFNFGEHEQWELVGLDSRGTAAGGDARFGSVMRFRNRRLRDIELEACVMRVAREDVPEYALDDMAFYDDELAYVDLEGSSFDASSVTTTTNAFASWESSPRSVVRTAALPPPPVPLQKTPNRRSSKRREPPPVILAAAPPTTTSPTTTPEQQQPKPRRRQTKSKTISPKPVVPSAEEALPTQVVEAWSQLFKEEVGIRRGVEQQLAEMRTELKTVEKGWMNSVQAVQLEFESINIEAMKTFQRALEKKMSREARDLKMKVATRFVRGSERILRDAVFRKWRAHAAEARRLRVSMVRFMLRSNKRGLEGAFDAWRQYAKYVATIRRKDDYACAKLENRVMRRYFERWVAHVSEYNEAKIVAARAHRRGMADRRREIKQKVLYSWYLTAQRARTVRQLQSRAVAKMRNRDLVDAFDLWRQRVEEKKSFTQRLMRAFKRWDDRTLHSAFLKWRLVVLESRQKQRTFSGVLAHWNKDQNKVLMRLYFHAWKARAEFSRSHRSRMAHVLLRHHQSGNARAVFHAWKKLANQGARSKRVKVFVRRAWISRYYKLTRVTFDAWRNHTERATLRRDIILKSTMRMRRFALYKAFMGWSNRVKTLNHQRRTLVSIVNRWRHRTLSIAWSHWKTLARVGSKSKAIQAITAYRSMERARLRRAFNVWRAEWRKILSAVVMRRISNRFATLNYFFRKWCAQVEARSHISQMVVAKRVGHNRFLDWYWDIYGEEFIKVLKSKRPVEIVEDSPSESFHTPADSLERLLWSPPKPRRLL